MSQSHRDNSLKKLGSLPIAGGGIDDIDDYCRQIGRHEDSGLIPGENDLNLEASTRLVPSRKSDNPEGTQFLVFLWKTWEEIPQNCEFNNFENFDTHLPKLLQKQGRKFS